MPSLPVHYLGRDGHLPAHAEHGGVTPELAEVTCDECRRSLRFKLDDFQRAYRDLFWAFLRR